MRRLKVVNSEPDQNGFGALPAPFDNLTTVVYNANTVPMACYLLDNQILLAGNSCTIRFSASPAAISAGSVTLEIKGDNTTVIPVTLEVKRQVA